MSSGILYTVATPIGHLGDMTVRAVETLKNVDLIACEDTRETKKLLDHYSISTRMTSYHAQSTQTKEDAILALLADGQSVALVSDRGTPGISDPGARLIQRAVAMSITVVPIPGATAVIAALQASGAAMSEFWFRGFVPHKKGRQTFFQEAIAHTGTVVFYESPHRILKCLEQLIQLGVGERTMIVARELTKKQEEFLRGPAEQILNTMQERKIDYGEFVVILNAYHHTKI
ncbi:MAG: 16S rRNA (cytidine(1402)-2'-O)-methyltransferase [Candidatus Kerfeldbacteria bacterium]|nr:16S rRNA (cytidine(1402)-2'-O)-methyltransferase [Candidatus Kerfeldbacteria bacterium]